MKHHQRFLILTMLLFVEQSLGAKFEGNISTWKKNKESFTKPQESFQATLHLLKEKYIDKEVTEADLYRAATEGMLASLNQPDREEKQKNEREDKDWNNLLAPRSSEDLEIQMTGKLAGIGATLEFDSTTKNAKIRAVLPNSAALKEGLQKYDQILSVNGKRFDDLRSMVAEIRGPIGQSVKLKILREDQILEKTIKRAPVEIPLYTTSFIDESTGFLMVDGFTKNAATEIQKSLTLFDGKNLKKLIIDLRGLDGAVFDQVIAVGSLFTRPGDVLFKTISRHGTIKEYKSTGENWSPSTKIVVLTGPETVSSAEVLTSILKEKRQATTVGLKTAGKWTIEAIEKLPNNFTVKYSVMKFLNANGKSFPEDGISPDFEINKKQDGESAELDFLNNIKLRAEKDPILKAAVELKL